MLDAIDGATAQEEQAENEQKKRTPRYCGKLNNLT
jgi:hypothetical protein